MIGYLSSVSSTILDVGGAACAERINSTLLQVERLLSNGNVAKITSLFNPCTPMVGLESKDIISFLINLIAPLKDAVQYG